MLEDPTLAQRVRMYLKPVPGKRYCCNLFALLLDTLLAWCFVGAHMYYVYFSHFDFKTDKIMLIMIGTGITSIFLIYSVFDAIRFLPGWCDKTLYVISCVLQKPILLPVLMPGSFFRSFVALRLRTGPVVSVRGDFNLALYKHKKYLHEDEVF